MYTVATDEKHAPRQKCETLEQMQAYVRAQPETCTVWVYMGEEDPLVSGPQPAVATSPEVETGAKVEKAGRARR